MKWRIAVLAGVLLAGACQAAVWTPYVAPDQSYSFHYPTGWKVTPHDAIVQIDNPETAEQLLLVAYPVKQGQTAQDVAT